MSNQLDLFLGGTSSSGNTDSDDMRLERLELLNWGTFDKQIIVINPQGDNLLVTGDIGSGKSTIVDALATLLNTPRKLSYNKAASGGEEGWRPVARRTISAGTSLAAPLCVKETVVSSLP